MAKIFISYRRDDSGFAVDRLYDALAKHVGDPKRDLFIDVDNIPAGVDFVKHLDARVGECEAMLVAIGGHWLDTKDPETGARRLDDPDDFVRIEIESALKRGIPVVPVLFGGARMPKAGDLPESLRGLTRRQAVPVGREGVVDAAARLAGDLGLAGRPAKRGGRAPIYAGSLAILVAAAAGAVVVADPWSRPAPPSVSTPTASTTTRAAAPRVGQVFRDRLSGGGQGPEMVVIPSGSFGMGSPAGEAGRFENEDDTAGRGGRQRTVLIAYEFAVGKYEVTWAEWEACVADGGCGGHRPSDHRWGKGNRPVINVSWEDVQAYADWLSRKTGERYRLLSEAEWEYVARAGTTTAYWWGGSASHEYANYGADQCCSGLASGRDRWVNTSPAGSFSANAFGLHDLHGNVFEWTEDCYVDSYSGAPTDGSARTVSDCSRRVLRGGSWDSSPRLLRSAGRDWINPAGRFSSRGFRVARTL
ncbi:MAG: SUMF1/EgtB/PvdO family nonheme iron enzyme [Pseudomonadota bacterium]